MAEVVIHRCTLRVVRQQGWSWGPAPDRLLKAAVAALPFLVARKLGDLFAEETEREITERVNLRVAVKLSELLEFAFGSASLPEGVGPPGVEAFDARLSEAIRQAFANETADLEAVDERSVVDAIVDSEPEVVAVSLTPSERVLEVLSRWQQSGELDVYLGSFSREELNAWFVSLCEAAAKLARARRHQSSAPRVAEALERFAKSAASGGDSHVLVWPAHFYDLLEVAEHLQRNAISEIELQEALARVISVFHLIFDQHPGELEVETELQLRSTHADRFQVQQSHTVLEPTPAVKSSRLTQTEFDIPSGLPFLLLGPLAQIGYLDTLAATLETANLTSEAPLFAAALAAKVLRPPDRGWRRDAHDLSVIAAFTGLETPPPGNAIAEFARKITGHLTPLDSLVSYTLVKGHSPGVAMMLHQTRDANDETGLLLVELEGLFPVAYAKDLKSLMPTLRYFSETHLLVHQTSARVETLRELHAAGFRFVTDAPPTRGESWREVRHPAHERLYTNDRETKSATLTSIAESMLPMVEQVDLLWSALSVQRPAIPTARHSQLELSLTMAASLALGTISWVIWRDRETTTPLLALERFGNLPARVRFTSSSVQLNLPLGRRQQDLREHGFLADLHDVPWLAGRKIEFLGG